MQDDGTYLTRVNYEKEREALMNYLYKFLNMSMAALLGKDQKWSRIY